MTAIDFEFLLIFYEELYECEIKKNTKLLTKLMYINARALGYKRYFNILPKKNFNKVLNNNPTMIRSLLRSSFYDFKEESLEMIEDEIELIIKYTIHYTQRRTEKKAFILTSKRKENDYFENAHFQNSKDISVKSGEETIEIINDLWKRCTTK
jgi:hypothetical protein